MLSKLRNWMGSLASPTATIQSMADGFEVWVNGQPWSKKYIGATDRFLREWFGKSWPKDIQYSRHSQQEYSTSKAADKALMEALIADSGVSFLTLLAGNFTSVCACLEVSGTGGLKRIELTHEEETPAFRLFIPDSNFQDDEGRDHIIAALISSGIQIPAN